MEERGATDLWSKIFGQEIDDALFVTARDANFIDVSGTAVIYLRELQLISLIPEERRLLVCILNGRKSQSSRQGNLYES